MSKLSVNQLSRGRQGYNVSDGCFRISMKTDLMAAGLAAGAVVFAMRPFTGTGTPIGFIERIRLQWTTVDAFALPLTVGRSLAVSGGTNAISAGGKVLDRAFNKGDSFQVSIFDDNAFAGGQTRIADTIALTGAAANANGHLAELSLTAFGNAGATIDKTFDFTGEKTAPVGLSRSDSGRLTSHTDLVIYTPSGMDADGTFELIVEVDTCELPLDFAIPT